MPEVSCQHLAQRRRVRRLLREQLLELTFLLLERLLALGLHDLEATVFRVPGIERRLVLFEDADDLPPP